MTRGRIPKAGANYRDGGKPGHRCHDCTFLEEHADEPATCERVMGTVRPDDVCDLFSAKDEHVRDTVGRSSVSHSTSSEPVVDDESASDEA